MNNIPEGALHEMLALATWIADNSHCPVSMHKADKIEATLDAIIDEVGTLPDSGHIYERIKYTDKAAEVMAHITKKESENA